MWSPEIGSVVLASFFGSATGAALVQFLLKILEKFFDEWRLSVQKGRTGQIEFADQLLGICNEASSHFYSASPRDIEHVNFVITKSEVLLPDLTKELENFVSSWVLYSHEAKRVGSSPSNEDIEFGTMLMSRADEARRKIIKRAHQLKK